MPPPNDVELMSEAMIPPVDAESVTYPNGTLQLAYETAGMPTYGILAIEADDLQRLTGGD
jgi:hypothetical protein